MDNSDYIELITCKGKSCGRKFGYIIKHLCQSPECKSAYTTEEYSLLEKEPQRITHEKKLSRMRSRYQKKKLDSNWMYDRVLQKRDKYDPIA